MVFDYPYQPRISSAEAMLGSASWIEEHLQRSRLLQTISQDSLHSFKFIQTVPPHSSLAIRNTALTHRGVAELRSQPTVAAPQQVIGFT
jgi:hypothetical protein